MFACRCVAENSAGRSEVTFKAWFNPADGYRSLDDDRLATDVARDAGNDVNSDDKSSSEVLIGASLGAAAVVLLAVAVGVVCVVRRRRLCHRKYAYYVRDDQRHGNGAVKTSTPPPHSTPAWIRRLQTRGRRILGMTSPVAEDHGQIGTDRDAPDDDDDDDKLVASTLQSLLESKQLFDEPRRVTTADDNDDEEKKRLHSDELLEDAAAVEDEEAADEMKEESNDVEPRCACSCSVDVDVDSTSKTDSELTGHDELKPDPAQPDLVTGDGHTFRRGGVARSPHRRSKPKVSFADCRRPSSSDLASVDSLASSRVSFAPQVAGSSAGDGVDGLVGSLSRHSCCVIDVSDSSPTTCSWTGETSRTGGGLLGPVRRSHSTFAFSAPSKVPPPPPTPLLKMTPHERRRLSAAAATGRHNEFNTAAVSYTHLTLPTNREV